MDRLPNPESDGHETIDCWWIAEDDRIDGSDNDSAVFVPKGFQTVRHIGSSEVVRHVCTNNPPLRGA
jgi:hypothetical protein